MSKYDEKVARIRSEHIQLLQKVKDSIIENKGHLSESLDSVITVLNVDEESTKKYEALVQAQELILSLTQEIVEADDIEKIIEVRKKVNYYINKIKNELKKRESNAELLEDYQVKVTYLRKDIAKYIRYLKRENILQEIEEKNTRYDELDAEEKKKFQRLVRNEVQYNTRNLDSFNPEVVSKKKVDETGVEGKTSEIKIQDEIKVDDSSDALEGVEFHFEDETAKKEAEELVQYQKDLDALFSSKEEQPTEEVKVDLNIPKADEDSVPIFQEHVGGRMFYYKNCKELTQIDFQDASAFLEGKVSDYKRQYEIQDTLDYGASPIKNFVSFLKNIPRYIHNKRSMKMISRDMNAFYSGSDIVSFYEYTKRRNSIREGLRSIFKKTHLYSDEDKYLQQHDKCSRWVYEFCKNNSMSLLIPTEIQYSR